MAIGHGGDLQVILDRMIDCLMVLGPMSVVFRRIAVGDDALDEQMTQARQRIVQWFVVSIEEISLF
jgi:hypothetical protein